MKKSKKKTNWQQYIGFVFAILIGVICGIIIVFYLDKYNAGTSSYQELLSFAGLLLGIYVAFFFHVIVHEAGHLIFGLLTGYKFSSFRIGSFMWMKENGKLKLKRMTIAGTVGQCLMTPPDLKDGKIPLVLYNLGGSLINIIFSVLFLMIYLICGDIPFLSPLLFIFAIIGLMSAMLNGIPMRTGTIDNDGYNAFALSKNKEAVKAFWIQLKVNEQNSKGIRLKDMPAEWFTVPTDEAMKNSMVATLGVFACSRLMDEEKFEEADALMAHFLDIDSGIVGIHRNIMMCDRIYIELIGKNRNEVIENMMTKERKKFMKAMRRFPSILRTEYVLALLFENDTAKAETINKEFENVAKNYPYLQDIESERELMQIAENKFNLMQ
ncbi:MAG: M50 family metallopeptidase [Clostridia bacterium]|nr:M50 family metallopeptidase [Clostridia bacterium]